MYRMTVEGQFSAAHAIRDYPGPCCRLHGHNYRIVVHLAGHTLDTLGMLVDYTDVKRAIAQAVEPWDHAYLNDLPEFAAVNPTSEALARILYHRIAEYLLVTDDLRARVKVADVVVYESERQGVAYGEE